LLKLVALLIILLVANGSQVFSQSKNIYGAYLRCEFVCTAIKINPDFTFEHLLDGDLFNGKRTNGTWRFIGRNKIKAESPKPSGTPPVKEKITNRSNFLITVTDFTSAVVPTAEVSGVANGQNFKCLTDENGVCEIPKCKEFDVAFLRYRGTYKVNNSDATEFVVELTDEQMETTIIDDIWLIEGNRLYKETDGTFDKDYYLEKVNRKKERKLFSK
jgi:hypothetical protein